jgi:hypothetical protein
MEHRVGALASYLKGPRRLQYAGAFTQEEPSRGILAISPTVGENERPIQPRVHLVRIGDFIAIRLPIADFWEGLRAHTNDKLLILLATPAGFEPATFSLEGCCSIP